MCRLQLPSLLLPMVLAATVSALPPSRRYNPGTFFQTGNGGHHASGLHQRYHPVTQPASRLSNVEENFYSSPSTAGHYSSEYVSRSSFELVEQEAPQYDHEKIVSSSTSEPQESRQVAPLRATGELFLTRRDSQSRVTLVENKHSVHNSENSRLSNQNHRTENPLSFSDTVGRRDTGDIVFPEAMNFTPNGDIKNCFQNWSKACLSNVKDYPYNYIEQVLANSANDFRSFFIDDSVDVKIRIEEGTNDDSVCEFDEDILYPKIGLTVNDQVLFIVNNDQNYKQGVKVEKCRKKDQSPCDTKIEVPLGYKTHCKQKYITRKMVALGHSGNTEPEDFRFPSCCSCYITQNLASFRSLLKPKDQSQ